MLTSFFLPVFVDMQYGLGSLCSLAFCGNTNFFPSPTPSPILMLTLINLMYMETSAILSEWAEIEKWIRKVLGSKRAGMNKETHREREQVQNYPVS